MWLDIYRRWLQEALHEQCRLRNENLQLQHKIAEYLTYKKVSMVPPASGLLVDNVNCTGGGEVGPREGCY